MDGINFPNTQANADFALQAAILYGLTHSLDDTAKQVQFKCPSGNCTWDPFESLAVCSICNDVSADLTVEHAPGPLLLATIHGYDGFVSGDNVTTFKLPNGLFIDEMPFMDTDKTAWMTSFGTGNRNETVSLKDFDTLIWAMSFLRPRNNDIDIWRDVTIEAIECGLYYCVNKYTPTVKSAIISELEEPVANAFKAPDSWRPYTDAEILRNNNWLDNLNFHPALSGIQRSDLMLGANFNVSQTAVDSISSLLAQTFTRGGYDDSDYGNITGFSRSKDDYEPPAMQPFISIPDLRTPFVSLARGMTNTIRADSDNTTVQTGRTGVMQTYYVIAWQWIALHVVVIVAGTVFMLITMYETRKNGIPVWTSSALAILARGEDTNGSLRVAVTRRDLDRQAETTLLRFCPPQDPALKGRHSDSFITMLVNLLTNTDNSEQGLVTGEVLPVPSEVSSLEDVVLNEFDVTSERARKICRCTQLR